MRKFSSFEFDKKQNKVFEIGFVDKLLICFIFQMISKTKTF